MCCLSVCLSDLVKLGLGVVEVGALYNLGELGVKTDTEVQHPPVQLHSGIGGVTRQTIAGWGGGEGREGE